MALNRIREKNNQMLIRLNRYGLQVWIRELHMYGDYQEAQNMEWCLSQKENLSDVDMSDEEWQNVMHFEWHYDGWCNVICEYL